MAMITVDSRYLLMVEIEESDVQVLEKELFKKDENGNKKDEAIKRYYQIGLLHKGRQNIEISISLKEGQPPYSAGQYLYHPNSFTVNKYGNLEIAYDQIFVPISEAKSK